MTASQFDVNLPRCRILQCKSRGVFAGAVLEELDFDPLRRAFCVTALQSDVKMLGCHTICPPKGVETKPLQHRLRETRRDLRRKMRHFVQNASNCEVVIQNAFLRGSKSSSSRTAPAKTPRLLRCRMRHLVCLTSNCEVVIQNALLMGVEIKLLQDCARENSSAFTWQNATSRLFDV